jgi:hypothetical protein
MYGLVNQAVKDLVCDRFGEDQWKAVCTGARLNPDDFEPMKSYSDQVTYDLVASASALLGIPAESILEAFGDYWITFTANHGYGEMMNMFGRDFKTCLRNLNRMHGHMGAMMPDLMPPRFNVVEVDSLNLVVHYFSTREGLGPMVVGLLKGLARKYGDRVEISHVAKGTRSDHDEFEVSFQSV